uniref:Cadherin domain-containing protein n=1 Tax=Parastrongyloides trichosuri TaxID=131310 RepID=A0A0N4Z9I7_PARTI
MLFSGKTQKSVVLRGELFTQGNDENVKPIISVQNRKGEDIFEVENIKQLNNGIYKFEIVLKNNLIISDTTNETIVVDIKAQLLNYTANAEIIADIISISQSTTNKSPIHDIHKVMLKSKENEKELIQPLKEIDFEENVEDTIIPFRNIDEENRINQGKDNILNIKKLNINQKESKNMKNIINDSPLKIDTFGLKVIKNGSMEDNKIKEELYYKNTVISGQKEEKRDVIKFNRRNEMKKFIDNNGINDNKTIKYNINESNSKINYTFIDPYTFYVSENSFNGTIIGSLAFLNITNDTSVITLKESESYLFKIENKNLILICKNKQLSCIDYEIERKIEILINWNNNLNVQVFSIVIINKDDNTPKVVLFGKEIKIANENMINQFLFTVTDDDGIDNNIVILKGDVSKHFSIFKAQDDGLYQIVFISLPPPGRSELSIVVKSKDIPTKSIVKNISVKVIADNHKARFRKDTYEMKLSGKNINKDEKITHLELEGVPIDSVDFYILEGNPGWLTVEKYGGEIKVGSNIDNVYNGKYHVVIGAINKENNKIVAKTNLILQIFDWLEEKPVFREKFYLINIEGNQSNETIEINILPKYSNLKMFIDDNTILGYNEGLKEVNVSKNALYVDRNKVKVSLKDIPTAKSIYFQVILQNNSKEKALVVININTNELEYFNELQRYSRLTFSNMLLNEKKIINVEVLENSPIGSVVENIFLFNPITGSSPSNCIMDEKYGKYFHIDTNNGDILLVNQIDYDTIENPEFSLFINCSEGISESTSIIMNVKVINTDDNPPTINIAGAKYPIIYEFDKTLSENFYIFNFTVNDIDGKSDHKLEILGDDASKFVIEKEFDNRFILKTAPNAIFDYESGKVLKLILIAKDNGNNTGREIFTIKFSNKINYLPYMKKKNFEFKVVGNWPGDVYVGTLYTKDADLNNTNIFYTIEDQPGNYFKVDDSGKLFTSRSLKNISMDKIYEMRVIVGSKLNDSFKDTANVAINVINPNSIIRNEKKNLQITQPKDGEVIKVSETLDVGTEIYSVVVEYNVNPYEVSIDKTVFKLINHVNESDTTFSIDKNGKIYINRQLNFEKDSKYFLSILVDNEEIIKSPESIIIFIEIENENNNFPYFIEDYTNKIFMFNESSIILASVKAIDKDYEPYNSINYHIIKHCGKNYNKLRIDMKTGEIRRAKYNSKKNKIYKNLPKLFEVCIYASQYNFIPKNSAISYNKNRKDQAKIKIKYHSNNDKKGLENVASNNYIHNNTIIYVPTDLSKLPILYQEDKINTMFHEDQKFKIKSFSLTPASYEPNAKILHINKNKYIFKINELSGDIIIDPQITTYPEGIYKIIFTLSNNKQFNEALNYQKKFHFVSEKNKMKFVFDTPVSKMGFRLKDFQETLQNIFKDASNYNKYDMKIYLEDKIRYEKNHKSSICFHIADDDIVKDISEYMNLFQTLFSKYPRLNEINEEYSIRNIMECKENWDSYYKKGFIGKVIEDNNGYSKINTTIIILLIISLILFSIFMYYCVALRYRAHLLIKKEHLRLVTNKRIMTISRSNEKQFVRSSPQFAIGTNTDLFEY